MNEEFSFSRILAILLPKWPLILIVTLLTGIASFLYSMFLITPVYQAGGTLYISGDTDQIIRDVNLSDLMLSQELAKTYGQILSSNTFFKDVAQKSGTGYDYDQIQKMTTITNVEETGILYVSVINTDPVVAYKLTNCILENAPAELERIVVRGTATVIDPAELPEKPASPSIPKNTLLGLFLGGFLAVAALLLRDLLDSTFKTAEQVEKDFGIPILGTIPTIEVSQSAR
ncbi:MAG: hypothetical protein IKW60_02685 [Clostridia bacterium]|nr:hypothetical protein [Clostridia bacterium]